MLSVQPGMVSTPMIGLMKVDSLQGIITPQACAIGILDKSTSFMTFGGTVHEISGLLTKGLLDLVPRAITLKIIELASYKVNPMIINAKAAYGKSK